MLPVEYLLAEHQVANEMSVNEQVIRVRTSVTGLAQSSSFSQSDRSAGAVSLTFIFSALYSVVAFG